MQIEIIGTAGAFAPGPNVSMIIWPGQDRRDGILLDCGFSVFPELLHRGLLSRINTVLLSHAHQDHCGSAIALAEYRDQIDRQKITAGGIDWQPLLTLNDGQAGKERVIPLPGDFPLQSFKVPHVNGMECLALYYNRKFLYSGDTSVSLLETPQAAEASLIVHDASLHGNPFHCSLKKLAEAPEEIKAKTWVTHYHPKDLEDYKKLCKEYGLGGVLESGMVFNIF